VHKSQSSFLQKFIPPKVVSYPDPATGHFNPFPTFPYTGSLRPVYPLSAKREVPATIQHPDYAKDGIPRSEQVFVGRNKIAILDATQIEGMRKVCRLAREVLDIAAREAKPGVTTDFIDEVVHKACLEREVNTFQGTSPHWRSLQKAVIPFTIELLPFSQVSVHITK
jgi:methionyl aminopeptidase